MNRTLARNAAAARPRGGRLSALVICGLATLSLASCMPRLGGGGDDGVRQVGDTTIVSDIDGGQLIIDGNGCQSVLAPGATAPEPVTDIDGNPVCTGSQPDTDL